LEAARFLLSATGALFCHGVYGYSTKAWQSSSRDGLKRMFLAAGSGHIVIVAAGLTGFAPRLSRFAISCEE
jgi:hypothetical protein